jgi:hypothetical protein
MNKEILNALMILSLPTAGESGIVDSLGGDPWLGNDDMILGGDPLAELAEMFNDAIDVEGEPMGLDEILGEMKRGGSRFHVPARTATAAQKAAALARLKAAGAYAVATNPNNTVAPVITPIPLTNILAGATINLNVVPTNSFRPDRAEFASSWADHQYISLDRVEVASLNIINGPGGVLCSQLSEARTSKNLRSRITAQANQPIVMTFTNRDGVNARQVTGLIEGPGTGR